MANISRMILLLFSLLTSFGTTNNAARLVLNTRPPAVFIFGDSLCDVGTNNYINTTNRANHKFYGIDYKNHKATGRWSNGYNMADYLCKLMGFDKSPPPFLKNNLRGSMSTGMFTGFNFASGGSTLFNDTYKEVDQFARVRAHLVSSMGSEKANDFLARSICIVSIGSNDIIRTFQPNVLSLWPHVTLPLYMKTYMKVVMDLYGLGARRFGFVSPLPIGCLPKIRLHNDTGGCITEQNDVSILFYNQLDTLLDLLSSVYQDLTYSLGNAYKILLHIISESENPAVACCGSGKLNAEIFCNANTSLCKNRDEYAFWDGVHPTENSAGKLANLLFTGDREITTPINFGELVAERTQSI